MSLRRKNLALILLAIILTASLGGLVSPVRAFAQEDLAVVLVIDVSGSMDNTDPSRLRETAAAVFIDLLGAGDFLSVITFGTETELLLPLLEVGGQEHKEEIKEKLLSRLDPSGATDFVGALTAASNELAKAPSGTRPVVVFLTDGDPNPYTAARDDPVFMAGYLEQLWQLVRDYALARYPVYAAAFSNEIDPEVIERISRETQGEYYLMDSPESLLAVFFELVSTLKNRNIFLEEELPPGRSFNFEAAEQTRQVNLMAEGGSLALKTPAGEDALSLNIPGLTVSKQGGSTLYVLQEMPREYIGSWEVTALGQEPVRVRGDTDTFVKAWFVSPVPFSLQPLNESWDLTVRITREERFKNADVTAEALVRGPEGNPQLVPLAAAEDDYYNGVFNGAAVPGEYEITVRLLVEGQEALSAVSKVYARVLPVLATDFWVKEGYTLGDGQVVTASLLAGGNRLTEGKELAVDTLQLVVYYADGEQEALTLFDSGNFDEHGDLSSGDGIWSNRFAFSREGGAEAVLMALGSYRGDEFRLEKSLGRLTVHQPGRILVEFPRQDFWSAAGGTFIVPLKITNNSSAAEVLGVTLETAGYALNEGKITLAPGEEKTYDLAIRAGRELPLGATVVSVVLSPENPLTAAEPGGTELAVEIVTARQAAMKRFAGFFKGAIYAAIIVLLLVMFFFVGGMLLYRLHVIPRRQVKGSLFYRKEGDRHGEPVELKLGKLNKNKVVISFDKEQRADFHIEGSEYDYDLIIVTDWFSTAPAVIQGWGGLFRKEKTVKTLLKCSIPGIIEHEGDIYTNKELFHEDTFSSGGFSFRYHNPYGRWYKESVDGVDILEGKV